ncbi:MAG: outer membrane beta-barrel protein [Spirosomataceae bacterium]
MKKLMICWALVALLLPQANAQSKPKPVEFLAYGGVNALFIKDKLPIYETHYGLGWLVGGGIRFGKRAFVQTGIELANQNLTMAARSAENTVVSNAKLTLRTVQIPLMAGIKLVNVKNNFADFHVAVGAKVGFVNPQDNPFNLKAANFSTPLITPSISFGIEVWKITLGLNGQYGGLTPVFKNYAEGVSLYTGTLSVGCRL